MILLYHRAIKATTFSSNIIFEQETYSLIQLADRQHLTSIPAVEMSVEDRGACSPEPLKSDVVKSPRLHHHHRHWRLDLEDRMKDIHVFLETVVFLSLTINSFKFTLRLTYTTFSDTSNPHTSFKQSNPTYLTQDRPQTLAMTSNLMSTEKGGEQTQYGSFPTPKLLPYPNPPLPGTRANTTM